MSSTGTRTRPSRVVASTNSRLGRAPSSGARAAGSGRQYHRLDKNNAAVLLVDHQSGLTNLVGEAMEGEVELHGWGGRNRLVPRSASLHRRTGCRRRGIERRGSEPNLDAERGGRSGGGSGRGGALTGPVRGGDAVHPQQAVQVARAGR